MTLKNGKLIRDKAKSIIYDVKEKSVEGSLICYSILFSIELLFYGTIIDFKTPRNRVLKDLVSISSYFISLRCLKINNVIYLLGERAKKMKDSRPRLGGRGLPSGLPYAPPSAIATKFRGRI